MTKIPRRLDVFWRIAATGFSFAVFGIFALVLACAVFPLFRTVCKKHQRRYLAQWGIQRSFVLFVAMLRGLRLLDFHVENAELLKMDAGCVIVSNHPSLADYFLLTALLPRCTCVVKEALWGNFFLGAIVRAAGYVPNRGAEEVIEACRERLAAGDPILIFPEGTRTRENFRLNPLQRGAANIAVRCLADLRVVHIACVPRVLTKEKKWWQTAPVRPRFSIRVGQKIRVKDFLRDAVPEARAVRNLNEFLANALLPP
ncbi:MAG: 1-acyl-sn-glycerol-3-phosphate acyltransferase [Puniceicoccales bacterium]|jgi:1-acyl-sn-glycerol-3-phosphate acyltransferase|nr:1-acyl-sn-glycerol-3-phosphate acyltransferase [Puniceicoccales bacterium]